MSNNSMHIHKSNQIGLPNLENEIYIPTHNYYTRYSAKFSITPNSYSSSNCSLRNFEQISPKSYVYDEEEESNQSDVSYLLPNYLNNVNYFLNENKLNMRVREYSNSCYGPSYGCPTSNKWIRPFTFFASIGLLVLAMFYINEQYSKSYNSISMVKKEIQNIKKQVDGMKEDVNNVVKIRDATEMKLNSIENILKDIQTQQQENESNANCETLNQEPVENVVKGMLNEYDADKTGKTDFALESAGGLIVSTGDTENFLGASTTLTLFGVPLCESSNNPRAMIQPGMAPGQCWAFKGSRGQATIKLLTPVRICGVTLEHISKSISPSGEISTAPKDFSIWGISNLNINDEKMLGQFTYDINGPSLQTFLINDSQTFYPYVLFKVHSNHGHSEFTCVYRLRVHGNI